MNKNILSCLRIKECSTKPVFTQKHITLQNKPFTLDNIFYGPDQEELFQFISKSILAKCIQGYNCTVFAYGQTGSGKTFTIQGTENSPGLIQRSLSFFHNNYDEIKLSFIEIYNENMLDLSEPSNDICVRDDPIEGVKVDNLTICTSDSLSTSLEFYKKGISNRKTAATHMNEKSSRSHSIFTIYLETKSNNIIKRAKLCFVDLAGSEKIGDNEVERIKETCNINKSLLCLGKIVHKLGSNDKWHISYRDSKLTFLLKDSLGGNSKLAIIGTVNIDYPLDTINTLTFLNRSKMISNTPTINYDTGKATIEELTESIRHLEEENNNLKTEIAMLRSKEETNMKSSVLYDVKRLKYNFESFKNQFNNVCVMAGLLIKNYYNERGKVLSEINDNLKELNERNKENINKIFSKKRKLEND
ncbi:hypothetical protein GINT2_000107 [Glugoides intestinalis]